MTTEKRNIKIFIGKFFLYTVTLVVLLSNPFTVKYIYKGGSLSRGVFFSLLVITFLLSVYVFLLKLAFYFSENGKPKLLDRLLNISLLIFFVLMIFVVVELSFRTVFKSFLHFNPYAYNEYFGTEWLKPNLDIISETQEYRTNFKTNIYGLRGDFDFSPKQENEIRIINSGDSYIVAAEVDLENSMSYKLEKYLNEDSKEWKYKVINAGKSGTSPEFHTKFLERNLKLFKADYLIYYLYVGNDVEFTPVKFESENPNIFYATINSTYKLLINVSYFVRYIDERLISKINVNYPEGGPCQPFDNMPEELSVNVFLKKYGNKMKEGYNNLFESIIKLNRICIENNVKFYIAFIPTKEQVEQSQFSKVVNFYKIDTTMLDMNKPQRLISDFLNKNQIGNIDLYDTLKEVSKTKDTYLGNDSHWNLYGNDIVARKMKNFLKDNIDKK